ncbi:hypothetical protein LZ30DRAFT_219499 [Colletotrichum cereale]|nr:hypothetical protein LZ30DRAFT_219499 [Colletotrichum cereale]
MARSTKLCLSLFGSSRKYESPFLLVPPTLDRPTRDEERQSEVQSSALPSTRQKPEASRIELSESMGPARSVKCSRDPIHTFLLESDFLLADVKER